MNLFRVICSLGIACFLLSSCAKASIQKAPPKQAYTGMLCDLDSDCTTAATVGERCDFLYAVAGGKGSCRKPCSTTGPGGGCPSGDACNPLSGFCEPNCSTIDECEHHMPQGSSGLIPGCHSNKYCYFATGSSGSCGTDNLKASNGLCRLSCSSSPAALTSIMACDPISKTLEKSCLTTEECENITYTADDSSKTETPYLCSKITSICVPGCEVGAQTNLCKNPRGSCYHAGNKTSDTGTCEALCGSNRECFNFGFKSEKYICVENVCQKQCTDITSCLNQKNGKVLCDQLSRVCRAKCSSGEVGLLGKCPSGTACSAATATCSPQGSIPPTGGEDASPAGYQCNDSSRNTAVNDSSNSENTVSVCEKNCSGVESCISVGPPADKNPIAAVPCNQSAADTCQKEQSCSAALSGLGDVCMFY